MLLPRVYVAIDPLSAFMVSNMHKRCSVLLLTLKQKKLSLYCFYFIYLHYGAIKINLLESICNEENKKIAEKISISVMPP